jgi:hypothetical protein
LNTLQHLSLPRELCATPRELLVPLLDLERSAQANAVEHSPTPLLVQGEVGQIVRKAHYLPGEGSPRGCHSERERGIGAHQLAASIILSSRAGIRFESRDGASPPSQWWQLSEADVNATPSQLDAVWARRADAITLLDSSMRHVALAVRPYPTPTRVSTVCRGYAIYELTTQALACSN